MSTTTNATGVTLPFSTRDGARLLVRANFSHRICQCVRSGTDKDSEGEEGHSSSSLFAASFSPLERRADDQTSAVDLIVQKEQKLIEAEVTQELIVLAVKMLWARVRERLSDSMALFDAIQLRGEPPSWKQFLSSHLTASARVLHEEAKRTFGASPNWYQIPRLCILSVTPATGEVLFTLSIKPKQVVVGGLVLVLTSVAVVQAESEAIQKVIDQGITTLDSIEEQEANSSLKLMYEAAAAAAVAADMRDRVEAQVQEARDQLDHQKLSLRELEARLTAEIVDPVRQHVQDRIVEAQKLVRDVTAECDFKLAEAACELEGKKSLWRLELSHKKSSIELELAQARADARARVQEVLDEARKLEQEGFLEVGTADGKAAGRQPQENKVAIVIPGSGMKLLTMSDLEELIRKEGQSQEDAASDKL